MPTLEPVPGKCGARLTDGSGMFCANGAGKGTEHQGFGRCYKHLGNSPNGEKHGKKLMAVAECETFGLPRQVDPHRALLEELWRANGWIHHLHSKLLDEGEAGLSDDGKPSLTWQLYDQQRQQLAKVAESCARVGVEERLVRVVEARAEQFIVFGQAMMRAMGVDPFGAEARRYVDAGLAALPDEVLAS